MGHTLGVRQVQKLKTRQALLDAGLALLAEQSLSSLGLREVTRVVGVAPTAFYRHFRDMADLGVALVDESLANLHGMITLILAEQDGDEERISRTVLAVAQHVRRYPAHVRFIARERHGGVRPVREAIAAQLRRFADEVADAFAGSLTDRGWTAEDVQMLAELYVDHMVMTATAFLEADGEDERVETGRIAEVRVLNVVGEVEEAPEDERVSDDVPVTEGVRAGEGVPAGGNVPVTVPSVGEAPADRPWSAAEERIARTARQQLRLISLGRHHWRDAPR